MLHGVIRNRRRLRQTLEEENIGVLFAWYCSFILRCVSIIELALSSPRWIGLLPTFDEHADRGCHDHYGPIENEFGSSAGTVRRASIPDLCVAELRCPLRVSLAADWPARVRFAGRAHTVPNGASICMRRALVASQCTNMCLRLTFRRTRSCRRLD